MFNLFKRKKEPTNIPKVEKSCPIKCSSPEDFLNSKALFINKTSSQIMNELEDEIEKYKKMDKEETDSDKHAYNEGYIDALTKATVLVSFINEN